ncbi:MAG TPA: hypothetical protein VH641_17260 [Streptosporangiaceae bacterium]|jgi:hypothetical protein
MPEPAASIGAAVEAGDAGLSPAVRRLLPAIGGAGVLDRLAALSGSDFTSVMLEVVKRRAAGQTPASVLRRYRTDRFVRPGEVSWWSLQQTAGSLLRGLPGDVEVLNLAPLVPLGTHSALATVSQDKVVTAVRACEAAADPTNGLALEAAQRRSEDRQATVRLAAVQRVVRAQQTGGAGRFAHFTLLGYVTAGRDTGSHRFERQALAEQLGWAAAALTRAGLPGVEVALTPLSEPGERVAGLLAGDLAPAPCQVVIDPARESGRGYYTELCFKINAMIDGEPAEVGDGGFTDWTRQLVASGKERLLISGLGIDRIAAFTPAS